MLNRFSEALQDIKEIKSAVNSINIEITRQHYDIYGNGKKGIIERIEDLENDNKNISSKLAYFAGFVAFISLVAEYLTEWLGKM